MSLPSYPKIYALGHRTIRELFDGEVLCQEKCDGSQFSFARIENKLVCKGHHKEIDVDAPDKMWRLAVESLQEIVEKLKPGWIYRGECLTRPKHNTLAYDRCPKRHVILFDIDDGLQNYYTPAQLEKEAARLDMECVPILYRGRVTSTDQIRAMLDRVSVLGGQSIEGVVCKNYNQINMYGHAMMGKYVSEKFKEVHGSDWAKRHPNQGDIKQQIAEALTSEARWNKAIQHLRERGELTETPKDIGPLMNEINKDIIDECADEIKEKLFKWAWKDIGRVVTRGFPQWYKDQVAELNFPEKDEH